MVHRVTRLLANSSVDSYTTKAKRITINAFWNNPFVSIIDPFSGTPIDFMSNPGRAIINVAGFNYMFYGTIGPPTYPPQPTAMFQNVIENPKGEQLNINATLLVQFQNTGTSIGQLSSSDFCDVFMVQLIENDW